MALIVLSLGPFSTVDAAWNLLNYVLQSRGFYLLNIYMWACIFNSDMWFTDCSYTTQKQLHVYHQSTLLHHLSQGPPTLECQYPTVKEAGNKIKFHT